MALRSADRRGSLMLMTLMFMTVMAVFVSVFLYTVSVTNRISSSQENNVKALYLAEAGLNKAMWYLLQNDRWETTAYPAPAGAGENDPKNEELGGGSYTLWVDPVGDGTIVLVASGTYHDLTRIVHQTVTVSHHVVTLISDSWGECLSSATTCP